MRRVITYGTYDLLHYGHINLLRRAKQLGDYLIVALSTDDFNQEMKGKKCFFPYEERKNFLSPFVTLILLSLKSLGSKSAQTFMSITLTHL